jgi:ABC-2 type transport system ATP-binding protein
MLQPKEATKAGEASKPSTIPVVDLSGVVKTYGSFSALSGIGLRVMPGEIYGLLGPNGAGKSTLIKIINGLLQPTAGSVRVMGYDASRDPVKAKASIGYVPETSFLYDSLSPRDFFEFVASVRKIPPAQASRRVSTLAEAFGLGKYYDSPIGTLSMGTKQKVSIIASLLHEPPLLLLDEPLNGLDAKSSRILKDLLSFHVQKNGGAVLFSTHIMEVAEHLCNRMGIIYDGRMVAEGSLEQLRGLARAEGTSNSGTEATLEEVFLRLTHEEDEVEETVKTLREAFVVSK